MPKITFVTQSSKAGDNTPLSPEMLVNLYPEVAPPGAVGRYLLRSVLGQESFASATMGRMRAVEVVNGVMYIVGGGTLYSVTSGGAVTNLGAITDNAVTTISGNGANVTVAAGGTYYVWDGSSLSQPGSGAFTDEGTVTFLDQRTIITERNGSKFEWTDLADPTSRQAANVASAEGHTDDLVRGMVIGSYLWLFGEESTEIWQNTGQGGANAFSRLSGGVLETGLLAANLVTKIDGGAFFISNDKTGYIVQAMQLQPIATPAVVRDIEASTPTNVFYYEDRGHKFCCIRFSDRPAWCFDLSGGLWHQRSTGVDLGAWEIVGTVYLNGAWYGVTDSGDIYKMSRTNADVNYPLKRIARSQNLYRDGAQFTVPEFELLGTFGESDLGRDAAAFLRVSRDGGRTFGTEIERSLGDLGGYTTRAIWRGLGRGRSFTIEVSITDAADIGIYSDANVRVA